MTLAFVNVRPGPGPAGRAGPRGIRQGPRILQPGPGRPATLGGPGRPARPVGPAIIFNEFSSKKLTQIMQKCLIYYEVKHGLY